MVRDRIRYASLALGAGALGWLAWHGVFPERNPVRPDEYIIAEDQIDPHQWQRFLSRQDVILALTFVFATAGPTTTLPADFNTASNQINAIGSGTGGLGGAAASGCAGGAGGNAGAGGAFAQIVNYSGHTAGQAVNVTVGAGDTVFDTTAILLAKAASVATGGQASASVGTTKFSGGNGGSASGSGPCSGGGGGGGGGGAAGPHGIGSNGANGISDSGGAGGAGDAGNTAAGGNGRRVDATHGSGGGSAGGGGGAVCASGSAGGNAGRYGAGGGGGGGSGLGGGGGGAGGNAFQGLIAIGYTPASGGGTARSFGFIIS